MNKEKPKSWAVLNDEPQYHSTHTTCKCGSNAELKFNGNFYSFRCQCGCDTRLSKDRSKLIVENELYKTMETDKPNIEHLTVTSVSKRNAVEWLIEHFKQYGFDFSCHQLEIEQAKAMEKEQIKDAIKLEIKLIGNYFDVGNFDVREHAYHIRFNNVLKDRYNYYNQY